MNNYKPNQQICPSLSHREKLALTSKLAESLSQLVQDQHSADARYASPTKSVLAILAIACLARRGLYPSWLKGSWATSLWENLTQNQQIIEDTTTFAAHLTRLALPITTLPTFTRQKAAIEKILRHPSFTSLLNDPLLPGYALECLQNKPRWQITGIPSTGLSQSTRAKDIQPTQLPALTQWFTPDWISSFLVEQSLGYLSQQTNQKLITFFDPACGAGHILVGALHCLIGKHLKDGTAPEDALSMVLSTQLFGCDIDPSVIEVAGFSLYLAARDSGPAVDLPLPNLFHFNLGVHGDSVPAAIGSLWLGLPEIPSHVVVSNFKHTLPLHQSVLRQRFSLVVTNPPYLSHRLMPPEISQFLKRHYPAGRFDLYAAFIILMTQLIEDGGCLGLICQQSFMSVTRYHQLRTELLNRVTLECLVQLGPGSFGKGAGEKVNNAILIARKTCGGKQVSQTPALMPGCIEECGGGGNPRRTDLKDLGVAGEVFLEPDNAIRCWRVLSRQEKEQAEHNGIASLPSHIISPSLFFTISGAPFSFWCPREIAALFSTYAPLESAKTDIVCTNGLFTCNNKRFVKMHWEVSPEERLDYAPYDKGGGHKWYRHTQHVIYWKDNGRLIRDYRVSRGQSASLPGENYYFQRGITYSYIGTKGFQARLLSPNSIFDIASSAIFSKCIDPLYLLGFLNSSLVRFLLGVLNPTINFQIGDLRRLPFAEPDQTTLTAVVNAAGGAIEAAKTLDTFDPRSPHFAGPALLRHGAVSLTRTDLKRAYAKHILFLTELNQAEAKYQAIIDEQIFELYSIAQKTRCTVIEDPWVARRNLTLAPLPALSKSLAELSSFLRSKLTKGVLPGFNIVAYQTP